MIKNTEIVKYKSKIYSNEKEYTIFDLNKLFLDLSIDKSKIPNTVKILIESILRNNYLGKIKVDSAIHIINSLISNKKVEVPIYPSNILMEDNAGIPLLLDLATIRSEIKKHGGSPESVNPIVKTNLIVDHSIQANHYKDHESLALNLSKDYLRNRERYKFLKWSSKSFELLNVIPPNSGISHQINLESLSNILHIEHAFDEKLISTELYLGSDSHTTMINSLGILGWGAGGIEVEASLLGESTIIQTPKILGVEIIGEINSAITVTDIVLSLTKFLRENQVVGKYLEFFGEGIKNLSLPDRATISNMAPEYGAKSALFPIDDETLKYLYLTGRDQELIDLIKKYAELQGLYKPDVVYEENITFDLSNVIPGISGPLNPHEYISINEVKNEVMNHIKKSKKITEDIYTSKETNEEIIKDGSIVIAAITSCTNTSNPINMITAGLLAKKAFEMGLKIPTYVKTTLAPGSRVVSRYLERAGLLEYLEKLGFNIVGYGCSTCAGSGGEISNQASEAILRNDLLTCSILSGNRNFPGRIHSEVKLNYLASPALVIAYAIAGRMNINLYEEKLNIKGNSIYLKDIWPSIEEVNATYDQVIKQDIFISEYNDLTNEKDYIYWNQVDVSNDMLYEWDEDSSYLKISPFCEIEGTYFSQKKNIEKARVLIHLGDNVSTDDISPGGRITKSSVAGKYLLNQGVSAADFNTYGARRGNHEVMMRGTFDNEHLENKLLDNMKGSFTKYYPSDEVMTIFEAALNYKKENTDLLIIAGKEYGTGSSRDWAAKGPYLLGVKAVIAESFEEIHRSNLVNIGILPLEFNKGENWDDLGLKGDETFTIKNVDNVKVGGEVLVEVEVLNRQICNFKTKVLINSEKELTYYNNGGILKYLTRKYLTRNLMVEEC